MRASLFLIAILAVAAVPLWAQSPTIEITTSVAPVDMLTLQDVDYINSTVPKWLFTITLRDRGTTGQTINAVMRLNLDVTLSNGESFPSASHYTSKQFSFVGGRSFTNLDLRNSDLVGEYGMDYAAKRRLEEIALPSGLIPAGIYVFRVQIDDVHTSAHITASFKLVLSNPSRIDLVFPMDNDNAIGQFPLFQWTFDGPRAKISIFERLPAQTSAAEVASGIPHVEAEVTGNSYLYPSAGVRPLEPGKSYVWFVEGLYGEASGRNHSLKSPLRSFTVSATGSNAAFQNLLGELERALGPNRKGLFDRIRAEALTPTGQVRINGTLITTSDLVKLISQFRNNPASVVNAEIE
jgi:hypothetical protein